MDPKCHAPVTPAGPGTDVFFGENSEELNEAQIGTISEVAGKWNRAGRFGAVRVDGYASCDGPADDNWRLSCSRAKAVAAVLAAPKSGFQHVPRNRVQIFANGETDRFSSSPQANRRVIVGFSGTSACGITISGPDTVDHYCAPYVPSDATSCGGFPAPSITLTGTGGAAPLRWRISHGSTRASIVGGNAGPTVEVKGDAASKTPNDVTVEATDGTCTSTHHLTVSEPTKLAFSEDPSSDTWFVENVVTYVVFDQFMRRMGPGICWDETVTICFDSHPNHKDNRTGDIATDSIGQVKDRLGTATRGRVPLPTNLCRKKNQVITVGGCGPLQTNTILFTPTRAELIPNTSCAPDEAKCP